MARRGVPQNPARRAEVTRSGANHPRRDEATEPDICDAARNHLRVPDSSPRRTFLRVLTAPLGALTAGCQSSDGDRPTRTRSATSTTSTEGQPTTDPPATPAETPTGDTTPPGTSTPRGTTPDPESDVVYRVNAGGSLVRADDDGPDWKPLISTDGIQTGAVDTYRVDRPIDRDASVPSTTPGAVFATEAWAESLDLSFDVTTGERYLVRMYLAEIYFEAPGERVFDVTIEGDTELAGYDIYADVGRDTGVMRSVPVMVSDGTLTVSFDGEVDNPKISAVEILRDGPRSDTLRVTPSSIDFGSVQPGSRATESITLRNRGDPAAGDPDITVGELSITGADSAAFVHDAAGGTALPPGETTRAAVTFAPEAPGSRSATLRVPHSGVNSPTEVSLEGDGSPDTIQFSGTTLRGFNASDPTALSVGPDGRLYVATLAGTVHAVSVTRTGRGSYEVESVATTRAITDIPNHDDTGEYDPGVNTRHVTGLTAGGTPDSPVVYVSSSDPRLGVGTDTDDSDTNSGAISRLTFGWTGEDRLDAVDHEVLVLGLPRSELDHNTNGLALDAEGRTLYVAQGGHTNKGAPSGNFGHTPEYALSGAILSVDLDAIEEYGQRSLREHDPGGGETYPDLVYRYALPTLQGTDLPFGGDDGLNMAKLLPDGPVGIRSPGYRNPYDVTLSEGGQVYTADNGPNAGWGGQPVDDSGTIGGKDCTNRPNESGDFTTDDQLHLAAEGAYGGHPNPTRGNPEGAGLYDADGTKRLEFDPGNAPVPFDTADPRQCEYRPPPGREGEPGVEPAENDGSLATFGPTGGITEYTASNFGGELRGDLLVVELYGRINRVQLDGTGTVTEVSRPFDADSGLGITAQGDADPFPGTVWTADFNPGSVTVFEPTDFGGSGEESMDSDGSDEDDGSGEESIGFDGPGEE
jgi:hypothetical protein